MTAYNLSWTAHVASGLLQECLRVNHTEGAAAVLQVGQSPGVDQGGTVASTGRKGVVPPSGALSSLCVSLTPRVLFTTAAMMQAMVKYNVSATLSLYHGLLRHYSEAGDDVACLELLQIMKDGDFARPDALAYALAAEAVLQSGRDMGRAKQLLKSAMTQGINSCPELWGAR